MDESEDFDVVDITDETPLNQPGYRKQAYPIPPPQKKSRKKFWLFLLFVLALASGGYAVKTFLFSKKALAPVVQSQPTPEPKDPTPKDLPDALSTKEYTNSPMGISLTYPDTWKVTEGVNNESARLESPDFTYTTTDQGTITGNFKVYIRKGARSVDDKYIGRGYAMQHSEKLTYTKPALGQRPETWVSQFGLDTPDNFAFFLVAGNFELEPGDTLGPTYGQEPDTFIIAGGYSAKDLKEDLQTNTVSPDYIKTSNAYKQAINILTSIKLSN